MRSSSWRFRWARSSATVVASSETERRLLAVFGVENFVSYATDTSVWRTDTLAASKSSSLHRRPSTSPRRSPVVAASTHAAYSRSSRMKSASGRAMASARCALRRRSLDAAAYTADRTSGCRNSKRSAATLTSPLASATASAPTSSSATAAALARVGRSPVSLAAARSSSSRAGSGSAPRRSRYIRVTRAPTVSGGSTGSEDPNDELSPASSMRASGLPPVPRWRRSSVASEERGAFCCVAPHERRARSAVETGDRVARQVGLVEQGRLVAAHGEHDRDGFGDEPTDGEQQGVGGRAVDPVRIVHEDRRGTSSEYAASSASVAPMANRSWADAGRRASAPSSASRWGRGTWSRWSRAGRRSSNSAANGMRAFGRRRAPQLEDGVGACSQAGRPAV